MSEHKFCDHGTIGACIYCMDADNSALRARVKELEEQVDALVLAHNDVATQLIKGEAELARLQPVMEAAHNLFWALSQNEHGTIFVRGDGVQTDEQLVESLQISLAAVEKARR